MPQYDPEWRHIFSSLTGRNPRLQFPEDNQPGISAPLRGATRPPVELQGSEYNPNQDAIEGLKALSAGIVTKSPNDGMNRNPAIVQALRNRYDLGPDVGDISQFDLQGAYDWENQQALAQERAAVEQRAQLGGFRTPQEAGEWERGLATSKVMSPIEEARIAAQAQKDVAGVTSEGGIERERVAGGYNEKVARIRAEQAASENQNFLNILRERAGTGDIRGASLSGVGSVSYMPPQTTSPALLNKFATAQKTAEDIGTPGAENELMQARWNVFWNDPQAPPETKDYVVRVLQDPRARGKSVDDLLAAAPSATLEQQLHIRRLLGYILGNSTE